MTNELCPVCGQPDNCGDCNHVPNVTDAELEAHEISLTKHEPPHVIENETQSECGNVIAYAHLASPESVVMVLGAGEGEDDGRSSWHWVRLTDGTLILGVFPRGETYFAVETDAEFPS